MMNSGDNEKRPAWQPAPWLKDYDRSWLRTDVVAGITVWALLVPQALAYGQLSGLPAVHGLYAALGALTLYGLYGTSRHLNVGPEATVATLAATIVMPIAGSDPERYLTLMVILALLTAAALLLGGILRLGIVTRLLSTPVLIGYITGSAIVIIVGQLDDLFGIEVDTSQYHTQARRGASESGRSQRVGHRYRPGDSPAAARASICGTQGTLVSDRGRAGDRCHRPIRPR